MAGQCAAGIDMGFVILGYTQAVILAVVQGITELLPISSTAYLRVVPALLGWRVTAGALRGHCCLASSGACSRRRVRHRHRVARSDRHGNHGGTWNQRWLPNHPTHQRRAWPLKKDANAASRTAHAKYRRTAQKAIGYPSLKSDRLYSEF